MKLEIRRSGTIAVLLGAVAASAAAAFAPYNFQPESKLWVEGTSTVRGYTCEAGQLGGSVTPAAGSARLAIAGLGDAVQGAELVVPVQALDCKNGTMNDHMRKALKSSEHANIRFRLSSYEVTAQGAEQAAVKLNGRLTIAGQEKPITMDATATPTGDGVRVKGMKEIVMTEYGVKPPSLMMGTMKVHAPVKVHFDMVLKP